MSSVTQLKPNKIEQVPLLISHRFLESLIDHPKLTKTAIQVAKKITKGYRPDWGYCCYSIAEIARWLDTTPRSVITALKLLEEHEFIHIDRTKSRNRYVPCLGRDNQKQTEKAGDEIRTKRKRFHLTDVKESSQHSIEKESSSLAELSPSYKTTKKPIARRAVMTRERAEASLALVRNWRAFEDHVLRHWRRPPDWDEWAFSRSVQRFVHMIRSTDSYWRGLPLATTRLKGWLKKEEYRTQSSWGWRGFDDFLYEE